MSPSTIFTTASAAEVALEAELTEEVKQHLRSSGLDDPHGLAASLSIVPTAAERLLSDERWPLEIVIRVIDVLRLPIRVGLLPDEERQG